MKRIAIVEGDGIGHEVIPVAQKVLELLHPEYEYFPIEVGYYRWEMTGCPCADRDIADLKSADAILFGAVTTPPHEGLPERGAPDKKSSRSFCKPAPC